MTTIEGLLTLMLLCLVAITTMFLIVGWCFHNWIHWSMEIMREKIQRNNKNMALNNKALKAGCEALRGDGRTIFPDVKGTKLIPHYPIKESKQQKEN